jgi:hypothetical protein
VLVADSTNNAIWVIEKGNEARQLVKRFHGHWLTRGQDGGVYAEAFQESGGAWSCSAFKLDPISGKLTEVAHRDEIRSLTFAVESAGSLVFQRGNKLVGREAGQVKPFRGSTEKTDRVSAFAWGKDQSLYFSDGNLIKHLDRNGLVNRVAGIEGKSLEPHIWNAIDQPSIFSLALAEDGTLYAAVPDLGKVFMLSDGRLKVLLESQDGWRCTGVATFGRTLFLAESNSRVSSGPRVRVMGPDGKIQLLGTTE